MSRSSSTDRRAPIWWLTPNTGLQDWIASSLQSYLLRTLNWIIWPNWRIRVTTHLDDRTSSRRTTYDLRQRKRTSTRNQLKILFLNLLICFNLNLLFCSNRCSSRRSCLWSYFLGYINRHNQLNCWLSSTHLYLSRWPSRGSNLTSWDAQRNF